MTARLKVNGYGLLSFVSSYEKACSQYAWIYVIHLYEVTNLYASNYKRLEFSVLLVYRITGL